MPQKTRKTKILSEQRKKIKLLKAIQTPEKNENRSESTPIKNLNSNSNYSLTEEEIKIKKYFLQDFKKSLLIIGLIFSLEIILYFASMSNYVSRLLNF